MLTWSNAKSAGSYYSISMSVPSNFSPTAGKYANPESLVKMLRDAAGTL